MAIRIYSYVAKLKMKLLSSLCLLLVALVGVSVQKCTIERFGDVTVLDTLQNTEATDFGQTFAINRTIYNCLSTSQTIGVYNSMSVSILYIRSDTPNQLREVRYNMLCFNNDWIRLGLQSTALVSSDTRRNCSACIDQAVNDHHCTRKPLVLLLFWGRKGRQQLLIKPTVTNLKKITVYTITNVL